VRFNPIATAKRTSASQFLSAKGHKRTNPAARGMSACDPKWTSAASLKRATRRDGIIGAYVWDYAGEMQMMRHFWNTAVALDPSAASLDEGHRFPVCHPEPLADLFRRAGVDDVTVRRLDVPTIFRNFDDYWTSFLGGQAPASGYSMSLSEDRRAALRDHIRANQTATAVII
jgi:hypothetical protein